MCIKTKNNKSSRTEPLKTPALICGHFEVWPLRRTLWYLNDSKIASEIYRTILETLLNSCKIPSIPLLLADNKLVTDIGNRESI